MTMLLKTKEENVRNEKQKPRDQLVNNEERINQTREIINGKKNKKKKKKRKNHCFNILVTY